MSGDASAREYYKIDTGSNTYVLCLEQANGQQSTDFIKMNSVLDEKIKRPKVLYYNLETSMIVQEDLGVVSLNKVIAQSKESEREILFKKCIDDIFEYQKIDLETFNIFENRSFDKEKIEFEFGLAKKYFFEEYLEVKLSKEEEAILDSTCSYFVDFFEARKSVVCHRDYHGRNLIYKESEIFHIDFQDSRIGPDTYDLCSLLEDCYFKINDTLKEKLLKYFYSKQSSHNSYEEFYEEYKVVAAQRIFKAIGSFTYLTIDKKKRGYEKNIGYAFENLRVILESTPQLDKFRDVLVERYYEN